jgi:CRP-like cAMP-binding protein
MNDREKIDRLRSLALFEHLSEASAKELAQFLHVERAPAGSIVIEEGSVGDTLYVLAEGQVRIEKVVEAGEFKELALLAAGDFFGEMALIEETRRSARARALVDTTLVTLRRGDLERWLQADPLMATGFFVELLRVLSHRLRRTSEDLVLLHELSHLAVENDGNETVLLEAALARLLPHLGEGWCGAAYLSRAYADEITRVAMLGDGGEDLPETLSVAEPASPLRNPDTLCLVLPGRGASPLGFLVVRSPSALSPRERTETEVALRAVAHLLSSAVWNLRHQEEERLRARLEQQQIYAEPF